jgi:hypothetical protein
MDEEFKKATGMSLDKVLHLYKQAVNNDWRTIQATTQQAFVRFGTGPDQAGQAARLINLSRAILKSENGDHLRVAGLAE